MRERPGERGVRLTTIRWSYFGGDVVLGSLALPDGGGAFAVLGGVGLAGAAVVAVVSFAGAGVGARVVAGGEPGLIVDPVVPAVVVFRLFTADSLAFAICRCCSSVGSVLAANAFTSGSFADFAIARNSRTS